MNKHTPGPWHMPHADSPFLDRARRGGNMIPIASEHSRIASVWHCNEPNARLIAAAPDLLAALEAARDELDSCDRFKPGLVKLDVMLDIRDAIAKARGD